jgi:CDP-6-deoxy-D-xylo-4-hexulose-3-dehydrase
MRDKIWYSPNGKQAYGQEEIDAVTKCLEDGWLAGFGPKTIEFEQRVAELFGKKYGVFVNSGSSANMIALASLKLPKGSKVLTPSCTFATTAFPIIQLGLKPIFVDVELDEYVPSVQRIMDIVNIYDDIFVIMIPNLIGNKIDWTELRNELNKAGKGNITLIEDSADTITNTPDSDISTTSFYASHIITSGGSGGLVMFNDEQLYKVGLQFRDWGRMGDNSEIMSDRFNHVVDGIPYDHKFLYEVLGFNFKSSEMNAAFGLVQLKRFDEFKRIRRENFERYVENLKDVEEVLLPNDKMQPNWLAIPLQSKNRLELLTYLEDNNIQTRVCFSGNITRHPILRKEYLQDFPNSDIIMGNGYLLGCHHGMNLDDVDYVCNKIKEFYNK